MVNDHGVCLRDEVIGRLHVINQLRRFDDLQLRQYLSVLLCLLLLPRLGVVVEVEIDEARLRALDLEERRRGDEGVIQEDANKIKYRFD